MDLYIALLKIYSDYNLERIIKEKNNIRSLLKKILNEKLVIYFPQIEIFYRNLIFKILEKNYCMNQYIQCEKNISNIDLANFVYT